MIPHKLSLKNFLSYQSPQEPLDFSQMHLVVLVGQNGHGKSALLDAMTWALWGKARAADDALMHLGSTEMQVGFEFKLGKQLYRVERKRHRRGKTSKPRLDLFIWDEDEARWQPLTEPTLKATQRKIEAILRMDYETFEHTAFLKQGEADAFTTATPKKRKEILGKVLNLSVYDVYARQAREQAKTLQREVDSLQGRLDALDEELAQQAAYETAIKQAEMAELQARLHRDASAREAAEARLALQTLESKQEARQKLARRLQQARQDHAQTETSLQRAQERIETLQALIDQQERIGAQYEQWQRAQAEAAHWDQVLARLRPLEHTAQALLRELDQARAELETTLALKDRQRQEAEAAAAQLPTLKAALASTRTQVDALKALEQQERRHSQQLAALRAEIQQTQQTLQNLQKQLTALPELKAKQASVQKEVAALETLAQEHQQRAERLAEIKIIIQQQQQGLQQLKQDAEDLKARKAMLERGETDACPVCHRPLGEDGRAHVLGEYEQQLQTLREQYQETQAALQSLKAEEKTLRAASKQADVELRRLPGLQRQLAQLQARLESFEGDEETLSSQVAVLIDGLAAKQQKMAMLQQAVTEAQTSLATLPDLRRQLARLEADLDEAQRQETLLPELREEVRALRSRLETGPRPDLQKKLNDVQAQLAALAYDETAHRQARETVAQLQTATAQWQRLQEALTRLPEEQAALARIQARWQRETASLAEDEAELAALDEALAALEAARERWRQSRQIADEAHAQWERAHAQLAAARQKLAALADVRQQRQTLTQSLSSAKERMHRFQVLEKAFGRDGVQAMIIEAALPELETEANRLLHRLSNGRMNVRLETQRQKKTGGVAEALDIIISDELGSRPYELYSGGEAFRVDLALRIALSRLLARRAGAALQTLFIDEGFGTQDAEGRENLVDALHMIKDEFELILIITHINELKDQFPVQILVEKTDEGSHYRVM